MVRSWCSIGTAPSTASPNKGRGPPLPEKYSRASARSPPPKSPVKIPQLSPATLSPQVSPIHQPPQKLILRTPHPSTPKHNLDLAATFAHLAARGQSQERNHLHMQEYDVIEGLKPPFRPRITRYRKNPPRVVSTGRISGHRKLKALGKLRRNNPGMLKGREPGFTTHSVAHELLHEEMPHRMVHPTTPANGDRVKLRLPKFQSLISSLFQSQNHPTDLHRLPRLKSFPCTNFLIEIIDEPQRLNTALIIQNKSDLALPAAHARSGGKTSHSYWIVRSHPTRQAIPKSSLELQLDPHPQSPPSKFLPPTSQRTLSPFQV